MIHPVPAAVPQVRGEKHEGVDRGLISAWVAALAGGDWSGVVSGLDESLVSHAAVFAAEEARRNHAVVDVGRFSLSQ